jgi:hypothetical protein
VKFKFTPPKPWTIDRGLVRVQKISYKLRGQHAGWKNSRLTVHSSRPGGVNSNYVPYFLRPPSHLTCCAPGGLYAATGQRTCHSGFRFYPWPIDVNLKFYLRGNSGVNASAGATSRKWLLRNGCEFFLCVGVQMKAENVREVVELVRLTFC